MRKDRLLGSGRLSCEAGLTLVEILVVLIILGIVITFLGGKLIGAGDQAKVDLSKLMIQEIQGTIEQFRLRYNSLPGSLEDLTRCTDKTGPGCVPLKKEDALNDAWGNRLLYAAEGNGRTYRLRSLGADGREGGEGVNYDITIEGP